jgi:hypothetical protein
MTLSYLTASITCDRYEDNGQKTEMLRLSLALEMLVDCRLKSEGYGSGYDNGSGDGYGSGDGNGNGIGYGIGNGRSV